MTLHVREVWRAAITRREKCCREKCHKRRKGPMRSGSRVQAVVWSVCWLPGCSEDAAGQGGERRVNYYTEREGWDALQSLLWTPVLGFQAQRGFSKKGGSEDGKRVTPYGAKSSHPSLMTGAAGSAWITRRHERGCTVTTQSWAN